jgi:hypothetical protein
MASTRTVRVATRERPKLLFDPASGEISHLVTGTWCARAMAMAMNRRP